MRVVGDYVVLAPTDLSAFLACRHRTGLDLAVACGVVTKPTTVDPFAAMLQRLGEEHEQRYVASLRATGLRVVDLGNVPDSATRTVAAMHEGADAIVQARLEGEGLAGYADILLRVNVPSALGTWSYEVQDTKLACETKGGTILQLSAYSALLACLQGKTPERFHVVTPRYAADGCPAAGEFTVHAYRVEDYAAYYRMVLASLRDAVRLGHQTLISAHYPEPVDACAVCRWERQCIGQRRVDDHVSFIANTSRVQRVELVAQGHTTLAAVAAMPVPVTFTPARGARETYNRIAEQARVQHRQRQELRPVFERLPIIDGEGLCRLPAPSPGDLFLDLEGARFAREGGREFLFGLWNGREYRAWWASNDTEEREAFESVMDVIIAAWASDPAMHVYHFNHYEPTAFKKLMGRHATRAEALDQLLRAGRFVDLYPITRQAVRAGVERYSIKQLEAFTGYARRAPLTYVNHALMAAELALEADSAGLIADDIREAVRDYNEDDCRSTEALRNWLESQRTALIVEGKPLARPQDATGEPSPTVSVLQAEAAALRMRLLDGLPDEACDPAHPRHHRWLLAYLVDFHKREENAEWWDYFRVLELPDEELLDEKKAVAGLHYVDRVQIVTHKTSGRPTGSVVDRYRYPAQEIDIGGTASLTLRSGRHLGSVFAHDRQAHTIDIKKGQDTADIHPTVVFAVDVIPTAIQQKAVMRLAARMEGCGMDLLLRRTPRFRAADLSRMPRESTTELAVRIVGELDATALAIQGPPGAGKTHTGAQMIRALVQHGKRVGVTANSHKVIRNLLDEVRTQSEDIGERVRIGHKVGSGADTAEIERAAAEIVEFDGNDAPLAAIHGRHVDVLGGTPFLWAREEYANTVDVLFVDEGGQMSLASALAVSQAAASLVLLGDPQQLDQPLKGTHPDGVGVSALQHVLGSHETMPPDRGLFLPATWRMSPALCAFTSELFYEGKLHAKPGLEAQQLRGTGDYDGSHLWLIPVDHDGNQSASNEEVQVIVDLVATLTRETSYWIDEHGHPHRLTPADLRIVAPFNAQVNRLKERLDHLRVAVGTVDKFQGQTAAVVIYSMTTSRPEDAPRGMEFLYSLNRLNVATSRARCAVFIVASPRLFEPECRTPRQMLLANALCRYREMAGLRT